MSHESRAGGVVLGVDQGTGSTKVVAVDQSGDIIAKVAVPISQSHPRPGWVEQDAIEIVASVRRGVEEIVAECGSPVAAIGLSSQRESAIAWDRQTGQPLGPMLGWQDRRTAARAAARADVAESIRATTGLPLDPMFSALKFEWLLDEIDPDRRRAATGEVCLGTVDSYVVFALTGAHRIEVGNASRTQLLDVHTGDWDPTLCELFSVPLAALPEVTASNAATKPVADLRRARGATIGGVLADSHAALYAHGIRTPGRVKATYGTGSSIMGLGECREATGLVETIAWGLPNPTPAIEGNILSSGATLVWLAGLLDIDVAELIELAAEAPVDHGVDLVPAFAGLGAPHWDEQATALIRGMNLGTDRRDLARAAAESVVLQIEDVLLAADAATGARVGTVMVDGGATSSDWLMQLQADLSQRTVVRSATAELSALGVARLAGVSVGWWDDTPPAGHGTVFSPTVELALAASRRERWNAAVGTARSTDRDRKE